MNRVIIAAVDDLFFASKIRGTAEQLGVEVRFVRNAVALAKAAGEKKPDLIIVNLQAESFDPIQLAASIRADENTRVVPLLGFYSHVLQELQESARQAGYTHIMPRSAFSTRLSGILTGSI